MNPALAQIQDLIPSSSIQTLETNSVSAYFLYLPLFKTISVLLTIVLLASALFFAIRTGWLATRVDRVEDVLMKHNTPKRRTVKVWQKVQRHLFQGDDNSLKLALLEADKILDDTLRLAGFRGENLGDRLKKLDESRLPNLDQVWEAHKLRNRLVHESDFKLNRDTAERALAIYEQAFRDLGILEQNK